MIADYLNFRSYSDCGVSQVSSNCTSSDLSLASFTSCSSVGSGSAASSVYGDTPAGIHATIAKQLQVDQLREQLHKSSLSEVR